ncbi:MAG TPA: tetratricopeptide repeat protein [Bacteroidales bacterium]|nr:tetratricopeptide repeat protein [Bacteroidales bacterium]
MKYKLFIIISLLFITPLLRANNKIDSLKKVLQTAHEDTVKIKILGNIANTFLNQLEWDSALYYCEKAIEIGEYANYPQEIFRILYWQGIAYYRKGVIEKALQSYLKALELAKKVNSRMQVDILNDIGVLYKSQGDYLKAIEYFQRNLEFVEANKDSVLIGRTLNNMANVYFSYGVYTKAIEYYERATNIFMRLGKLNYVGYLYMNTGVAYKKINANDKALEYFRKSQEIFTKIGFKPGLAQVNGEMGTFYAEQGDYNRALRYVEEALNVYKSLGEKLLIAQALRQLGEIYQKAGSYGTALQYYKQSIALFKELNAKKELLDSYENMASVYSAIGNYKQAYEYYKIYSNLKDSVLSEDYLRQMQENEARYENEKKENEIKLQKAELAKKDAESKRKSIFLLAVGLIALMVMGFSIIIFKQYAEKKKANILLAEQNEQIKKQRDQIFQQKKEITDSIHYASRIQRAVLPSPKVLEDYNIQYFILYKPRDIVSGDFYWINAKDNKIIVTAADCTGHGVPGAFMSMLGMALLNEITSKSEVTSAAQILDELRTLVIKSLHQSGSVEETKDGMDMALCVFDTDLKRVQFAGAFNPLYLVRGNELIEGPADRMPVGFHDKQTTNFTNTEIPLQPGDTLYIFSDGYVDQFGGENGKKFMANRFKQLLIDIHYKAMEEQKQILDVTITEWRGELDQVDDILVIGMRV